jgi:DNA repair protein RecO (recombination protein O)
MAETTVEAIVLRRSDSGESDRRLVLLTRELGKIDVIARGARKGGSRLAGSSEPLMWAEYQIALGRQRRFVAQVQPKGSFPRLRNDYDRLAAALSFTELVSAAMPYESEAPEVFDLVLATLDFMQSEGNWLSALVWAESQLMRLEGHWPEWTVCVNSGVRLTVSPVWVSPTAGGHISDSHRDHFRDAFQASAEALIGLERVIELSAPPKTFKKADECLKILHAFWKNIVDMPLTAHESLIQGLHLASNGG